MKRLLPFLLMLFLSAGCTSVETFSDDYMKADEYREGQMSDAWKKIKTNYLGAPVTDADLIRRAELLAHDAILKTEYKDKYEALAPMADPDSGMPETFSYIFVHFDPKEETEEAAGTTYLVVVHRHDERVIYSGVYEEPKGDPFYKYHSIVQKIQGR